MANLVIATLSRMIDQAMAWGVAGEMSNPCRSAPKYRTRRRERFLTDAEFQRLGRVLDEMEAEGRLSPYAAAALRLLMLTGCRRNEILTLRWEDVHLQTQELHLSDSKTGPRTVSLSPEAAAVLASTTAPPRQPLGDPRREARRTSLQPVRALASGARPRRSRRRAHPRPAAQLRLPRAGAGREPAGDRQASRPRPDPDHRTLHPPHTRRRQRRSRKGRGRNSRRHFSSPSHTDPTSLPAGGGECRSASLARICAVGAAKHLRSPSVCGVLPWQLAKRPEG